MSKISQFINNLMELKSKVQRSPSFYETWQSYFKLVVRQDKEKNERGGSYHNKYQDFLWSKGNQNSVLLAEDRLADQWDKDKALEEIHKYMGLWYMAEQWHRSRRD